MGRKKAGRVRDIAEARGWLTKETPLPEEAVLAAAFPRKTEEPDQGSLVLPFAQDIRNWHQQGIQGTTIHEALVRRHGFTGSYSAVRRFLRGFPDHLPRATVILDFEPGEAAQVDFGTGPRITDVYTALFL